MIHSISGTIIQILDDALYMERDGICWELQISLESQRYFSARIDDENGHSESSPMRVYTWLHANERGITLYGFHSLAERSVFLTLQKVDGIGPKAALKILSHTSPEDLMANIRKQDTKALAKISGIGPKKASKILLTLEGVYIPSSQGKDELVPQSTSKSHDILQGLERMGYDKLYVEQALAELESSEGDVELLDEGQLMQKLIKLLEGV